MPQTHPLMERLGWGQDSACLVSKDPGKIEARKLEFKVSTIASPPAPLLKIKPRMVLLTCWSYCFLSCREISVMPIDFRVVSCTSVSPLNGLFNIHQTINPPPEFWELG